MKYPTIDSVLGQTITGGATAQSAQVVQLGGPPISNIAAAYGATLTGVTRPSQHDTGPEPGRESEELSEDDAFSLLVYNSLPDSMKSEAVKDLLAANRARVREHKKTIDLLLGALRATERDAPLERKDVFVCASCTHAPEEEPSGEVRQFVGSPNSPCNCCSCFSSKTRGMIFDGNCPTHGVDEPRSCEIHGTRSEGTGSTVQRLHKLMTKMDEV